MKKSITKILLALVLSVFCMSTINVASTYAGDLYFFQCDFLCPDKTTGLPTGYVDPFLGSNYLGWETGVGFVEITGGYMLGGATGAYTATPIPNISPINKRNDFTKGFTFEGYYDKDGNQVVDKDGNFSTAIDDSYFSVYTPGPWSDPTGAWFFSPSLIQLTAKWKRIVNKITLDDDNGNPKKFIYKLYNDGFYSDESCDPKYKISTISVPTKYGYTFEGYRSSDSKKYIGKLGIVNSSYSSISLDEVEDVELAAKWTPIICYVDLYDGGSTALMKLKSEAYSKLIDIASGNEITKIDMSICPKKEGQVVDGFYFRDIKCIDKDGNIVDPVIYTKTMGLNVKYEKLVYSVILCKDNDGSALNNVGKLYCKYNDNVYVDKDCKVKATNIFKQGIVSTPSLAKALNTFGYFGISESLKYIEENGTVNWGNIVGAVYDDKDLINGIKSDISLYAVYKQDCVEFNIKPASLSATQRVYLYGGERLSRSWNDPYNEKPSYNLSAVSIPTSTDPTQKFAGYQDSSGVIYIDEKGNIKPIAKSLPSGSSIDLTSKWVPVTSPTDPTTPVSPTDPTKPVDPTSPTDPTTDDGDNGGGNGGGNRGGSKGGSSTGGGVVSGGTGYSGWKNNNGKWYFYINATTPYYGWICENGVNYYYLDHDDGDAMAVGYRLIKGILYYFKETGVMAKNELINDVQVGADGAIARIDNWVKAPSYAKDEKSGEYYLLDDKNAVIHDSIATCKGLVYATQQFVNTNIVPTLRFGLIEIGDVVLNFNPEKGGYLDNVFKKSKKVFGNAMIIKETGLIVNK